MQPQQFGRQQQREQHATVNTVGATEPTVEAVEATAAAAAQAESAEMREISHNTTLDGTAVQATNGGAEDEEEDADWMEVMAAVEMAANNRVIWDTEDTTRSPQILMEEQPEQRMQWLLGVARELEAAEAEAEDIARVEEAAVDEEGGGATGEESQAQSKIFDPGILDSTIVKVLEAK